MFTNLPDASEQDRLFFEWMLLKGRMMDQRDKIKADVTDCTMSLAIAVQQAGGGLSDRILNMSVREFISTVAGQNNIRFTFVPPQERKDEHSH